MGTEAFNIKAKEEENPYKALNEFSKTIYLNNVEKGFYEDEIVVMGQLTNSSIAMEAYRKSVRAQRLALITSELSEALEADRKNLKDDHLKQYYGFDVEIADALIRILDLCGAYKIDIGEILCAKLEYNKSRPHRHGKAY